MSLLEKLQKIQQELEAPKGQWNDFSKFHYRSCEDILTALKPLLEKHKCVLTLSDEILQIGERFYVRASAQITDVEGDGATGTMAWAREADTKKGMDEAQITGSASSYARKYALNGLFAIDDTKDPDTKDNSKMEVKESSDKKTISNPDAPATDKQKKMIFALAKSKKGVAGEEAKEAVKKHYGLESFDEINKGQASKIISAYVGLPDKKEDSEEINLTPEAVQEIFGE